MINELKKMKKKVDEANSLVREANEKFKDTNRCLKNKQKEVRELLGIKGVFNIDINDVREKGIDFIKDANKMLVVMLISFLAGNIILTSMYGFLGFCMALTIPFFLFFVVGVIFLILQFM